MRELTWSLHRARPSGRTVQASSVSDAGAAPAPVPVVALHGFATTASQCWADTGWLRRLGRERDVVLIGLPGHPDPRFGTEGGIPAEATGSWSLAEPAPPAADLPLVGATLEGVEGVLEAVGQAQGHRGPVDVLGYSFGARLAWEFAARHPERVRRLVCGGLPATDHLARLGHGLTRLSNPVPQQTLPAESAPEAEPVARVRDLMVAASGPQGELVLSDLVGVARQAARTPFRPVPAPPVPTLLALGEEDRIAADGADLLPLLGPHGQLLLLPGRGHVDALTSGVFVRAVARFLASAAPPPPG